MNLAIFSVVLATVLASAESHAAPSWHSSYAEAYQSAINQQKPLVVMFGPGANGWVTVNREEGPTANVLDTLGDKYICVYINTSMPEGKKLAQEFGMTADLGIVIGSRDGSTQAFWHQGDMTRRDMAYYLQKYADPNVVVNQTETLTTTRTSMYPPSEPGMNWGAAVGGGSYCPSCNGGRRR